MNNPNKIIIHCSGTPDNKDFDVEDIRKWHKAQGWRDVGYNYVIKRDGTIQIGRLETEVGAHVRGHNANSLGICLIGNNEFSFNQHDAFNRLYWDIYCRHSIEPSEVYGHYEFDDNKTCPNIDMDELRSRLWQAIL